LSLNRGVFNVFHDDTQWQNRGPFAVYGERAYLFNDPTCFRMTGVYAWERVEGGLSLTTIEDG